MGKIVFLVRHGDHLSDQQEKDGSLSPVGIQQAKELAGKIKEVIIGKTGKVTIYTSPAKRAVETAEILQHELGWAKNSIKEQPELFTKGSKVDLRWLDQFIEKANGITIIVTHIHYARQYPQTKSMGEIKPEFCEGIVIENDENFYEISR
jgi:phosphohistidine phosphatase SixA